jgi:peptidyl-prolyl cis-trans isomerase C
MIQSFNTPWALSTAAAVAVLLTACGKGQQAATPAAGGTTASAPVATVDGTPISRTAYDIYLKSLLQGKQPPPELTPEQKNGVLDELISMQLLATQAVKDGVDKDPDVQARLDLLRIRILADGESQKYLKGKEPTDMELHAEYDNAVAAMDKTPKTEYHARHILVASKEAAEKVIKLLKAGAKFEDLAKSQSTDSSKNNGGDLGWFSAEGMEKPFGDAVKAMKKGDTSAEPVQTKYGWHVINLEDIRQNAPTPPPFDRVKPQLTNGVMQKKLLAYVDQLKKTAKIDKKPL